MTDCKNCKYTDEYCASGECTSQSPRNGSQKGDLTSQWKKGELPEGDYFISNGDEIYPDYYDSAEGFLKTYNYGVRRVLAPVPSYDELQNMNKAVNECMAANIKLVEENAQLKELLKKANKFLKDYGFTFDGKDCAEAFKVHTKINEVLK